MHKYEYEKPQRFPRYFLCQNAQNDLIYLQNFENFAPICAFQIFDLNFEKFHNKQLFLTPSECLHLRDTL